MASPLSLFLSRRYVHHRNFYVHHRRPYVRRMTHVARQKPPPAPTRQHATTVFAVAASEVVADDRRMYLLTIRRNEQQRGILLSLGGGQENVDEEEHSHGTSFPLALFDMKGLKITQGMFSRWKNSMPKLSANIKSSYGKKAKRIYARRALPRFPVRPRSDRCPARPSTLLCS